MLHSSIKTNGIATRKLITNGTKSTKVVIMAKAKVAYFPHDARYEGVDVCFTKSRNSICIGGWYDSCVAIESTELPLKEFFDKLGITESDCKKAFLKEKS
jgi:hypothetical protein